MFPCFAKTWKKSWGKDECWMSLIRHLTPSCALAEMPRNFHYKFIIESFPIVTCLFIFFLLFVLLLFICIFVDSAFVLSFMYMYLSFSLYTNSLHSRTNSVHYQWHSRHMLSYLHTVVPDIVTLATSQRRIPEQIKNNTFIALLFFNCSSQLVAIRGTTVNLCNSLIDIESCHKGSSTNDSTSSVLSCHRFRPRPKVLL